MEHYQLPFLPLRASSYLFLPLLVYTKLVTNKWNVQGQNITNYLSYLS